MGRDETRFWRSGLPGGASNVYETILGGYLLRGDRRQGLGAERANLATLGPFLPCRRVASGRQGRRGPRARAQEPVD